MSCFLPASIDRAIVLTQYELEIGTRCLHAITVNFMIVATGGSDIESASEDCSAMYRQLAMACDVSQRRAIQRIIRKIVKQNKEMETEIAAGERKPSPFLQPIDENNAWGRAMFALAEAFRVKLERVAA